jgi:hypothetical protein
MRIALAGQAAFMTLCCCVALSQTEDATVQERLAKHAEVFMAYAGNPRSIRLEDLKPDSEGIIASDRRAGVTYMMFLDGPITEAEELKRLAGRVDVKAVISGTTVRRYSAIDPTHAFLYSDWIVKVSKVYKNKSTVQVGAEITVTRMGGDLTLNGRHIIDKDPIYPEFALNHDYVFYLRALPDTSSFYALGAGTFDVTGATPILLADPHNPTGLWAFSSWPIANFLSEVEWSAIQ